MLEPSVSSLNPPPLPTVSGPGATVESLLRQPQSLLDALGDATSGRVLGWLGGLATLCLALYGVIVGSFSGHEQYWAAPLKITLGLFLCGLICLPSLYVITCLGGCRAKFGQVVGLLLALHALAGLLLASFGPVAWVFSQSTQSLGGIGTLHVLLWLVATGFGIRMLMAGFRQLETRTLGGVLLWSAIYVVVVLQMSTALRPILGRAPTLLPTEKRFFLQHWANDEPTATPGRL